MHIRQNRAREYTWVPLSHIHAHAYSHINTHAFTLTHFQPHLSTHTHSHKHSHVPSCLSQTHSLTLTVQCRHFEVHLTLKSSSPAVLGDQHEFTAILGREKAHGGKPAAHEALHIGTMKALIHLNHPKKLGALSAAVNLHLNTVRC